MVRNKEIESIFRTLYRPLCLYALHHLGDTEAVEDVVQDSFIALWNSGERVENAKAWMYRAVRNRCIDQLRRNRASEMAGEAQEPLPNDLEGQISDEEAMERSAVEARLWEAVEALPEMRRKCLLMAKRDGLSYKEIAQELGIAEHTVRNHISRALESLREKRGNILQFIFSFF